MTLTPGLTLGWRSGQTYQRQVTRSIAAPRTNANYGKATSSANYALPRQLQLTFLTTF